MGSEGEEWGVRVRSEGWGVRVKSEGGVRVRDGSEGEGEGWE